MLVNKRSACLTMEVHWVTYLFQHRAYFPHISMYIYIETYLFDYNALFPTYITVHLSVHHLSHKVLFVFWSLVGDSHHPSFQWTLQNRCWAYQASKCNFLNKKILDRKLNTSTACTYETNASFLYITIIYKMTVGFGFSDIVAANLQQIHYIANQEGELSKTRYYYLLYLL